MKTIKDKDGRGYNLSLNINSYRRVLADTGIDLGLYKSPDKGGQPLSAVLWDSIGTTLDVLWSMVRHEAQKDGVSKEKFETAMFGATFQAARDALFEEWSSFFRVLGKEDDARLVQAFATAAPAEVEMILQRLARTTDGEASTTSSNNTPESPVSPTPEA